MTPLPDHLAAAGFKLYEREIFRVLAWSRPRRAWRATTYAAGWYAVSARLGCTARYPIAAMAIDAAERLYQAHERRERQRVELEAWEAERAARATPPEPGYLETVERIGQAFDTSYRRQS